MRSLLFVDDNDLLAETVVMALGNLGLEVAAVQNAEHALTLLNERRVDAAVIDVHLGDGTGGIELARQVLESSPGVAVVLTTAYAMPELDIPEGATVLEKPYRFGDLFLAAGHEPPLELPSSLKVPSDPSDDASW